MGRQENGAAVALAEVREPEPVLDDKPFHTMSMPPTILEATQGQISTQFPTDAISGR